MAKTCLMLLAVLPPLLCAQPAPDYSGTWKLDTLRSRFDKMPAPKSLILRIDQQNTALDVKMTEVTHSGENNEMFAPHAPPSKPTAAWDGEYLVLQCHHDTPGGPVDVTRRLKRGDKGKIMTAVVTVKDKSGQNTAYEFYVKE